jgi:hypothetical protein
MLWERDKICLLCALSCEDGRCPEKRPGHPRVATMGPARDQGQTEIMPHIAGVRVETTSHRHLGREEKRGALRDFVSPGARGE